MDDLTVHGPELAGALEELRWVNRLLGGYATTMAALAPYLRARRGHPVRILDLGTGAADHPEHVVRWADHHGADVHVVGLDANAAAIAHARDAVDRRLPSHLARRIELVVGDALEPPFEAGSFDVVHAALFCHHFADAELVRLLAAMNRLARDGVVVNDLHRHALAYGSILFLATLLPVTSMFRHDGPLSVRRAFTREELRAVAERAGLGGVRISWHWAFRWCLSTLPAADGQGGGPGGGARDPYPSHREP